jgi:hypothetical protein
LSIDISGSDKKRGKLNEMRSNGIYSIVENEIKIIII